MTVEIRFGDFGAVIDNPLDIDDLEELLVRLPDIIKEAKLKEREKVQNSLEKAEARVIALRTELESLR